QPATPDAWVARVHEDDRPRLLALREEISTSKTKDSFESTFRIVRPDGTIAWIQSRGRVDRDADGNVTRLTGLDLDFNQNRRTEEGLQGRRGEGSVTRPTGRDVAFNQHRRTEEALQARRDEEHDRELRLLLETATQGIGSVDAHRVILTHNRAPQG